MFALFFQHKNFMISILSLLSLSIICQIVMGVIYHKLIWETENMSTTANKSLQQLKLKFSSRSKINEGVPNVSVFVDKFMNQIKVGCFPLSFLKHLSGQLTLLAVLVAGIGACLSIIHGEDFFNIAPFYAISFLGLYCYFAVSSLVDIPGKTKVLRTNLVDYLENHLANRLEQTKLDIQLIEGDKPSDTLKHRDKPASTAGEHAEAQVPQPDLQDSSSLGLDDFLLHTDAPAQKENSPAFSKSEAEELELLLKEFLT